MKAAARALEEGDYDDALSRLLAAWDATRAPELATLIEEVSTRVAATLPALDTREQRRSLAAWVALAREKRPSDLERLLADLVRLLAVGPAHVVVPRLDELLLMPPDPRIGSALVATVPGPFAGWNRAASVRVVKALVRHGDARLARSLEPALALRTPRMVAASGSEKFHERGNEERFASVLAAWARRAASPAPDGIDGVRAALARAPAPVAIRDVAPPDDGASLLAAIHDDLSDDTRRLVYADHLGERGDRRGEFIVLQLERAAGRGTAAKDRREKALLKAHASAWLGPLASEIVVSATEWERGFPVATRTKVSKLSQAESSLTRPEWRTFERVEFAGACLITEQMRSLTEARGVTETAVRRMARLGSPPPRLHTVELEVGYNRRLALDEPVLAPVLALPSLRALRVHFGSLEEPTPATVQRFCEGVGERLERLIVTGGGTGTGIDGGLGRGSLTAPFLDGGGGAALRVLGWGTTRRCTPRRAATRAAPGA